MFDQLEARLWADHHESFAAWVRQLPGQARSAFEVLARIQYAAPWEADDAGRCAVTTAPGSRSDASARPCRA